MKMSVAAWCRRLTAQLPGWHVWFSTGPGTGWYAVPAPSDMVHGETLSLPGRLGPYRRAQDLRDACRERYGWDDFCQSCGELARDCGHRAPESSVRA